MKCGDFCTFTTLSLHLPEEEEEEEEEEKVVATHRATSVAALFRVGVLLVRPHSSPPRRRVAPLADVCTRRIKREPSVAGVLLSLLLLFKEKRRRRCRCSRNARVENALLLLLLLLLLPLLLLLFDGGVGVKRDDARAPKDQKGDETNRPKRVRTWDWRRTALRLPRSCEQRHGRSGFR